MRTLSLFLLTAAACTAAVTPPDQIKVAPGFKVELLREAGPREGSWICMAQDDQGRLYISPQNAIPESGFAKDSKWGGMWRVTLADVPAKNTKDATTKGAKDAKENKGSEKPTGAQPGEIRNPQSAIRNSEEPAAIQNPKLIIQNFDRVPVPVGDAMGMLWAFDSLYVSGMGPQGRGIYRCTSSKRDGHLDTATLFKAIPGGAGEHGAHAIILGPDKKLYIVNGNSTGILDGLAPDSPYRNWGEDDLLPRLRDPVATFFDKIKAPYGCVYRTDADGTKWDIFAGGFRNPYDIAFNADGELFTYDADMEWDRGLPWYRPTRLLHVVPGGEYGFREGSAKWPAYFPDSLPAVVDIGVGCPTGIAFYPATPDVGTGAKGWPEKYRRALFMHDWTYGRILAVHLREKGASYTAQNDLASTTYPRDAEANHDVEVFLSGKGMPVTAMQFLRDGSMLFTTGGRGTASALYRVSWAGGKIAEDEEQPEATRIAQGIGRMDRHTTKTTLREIVKTFTPQESSLSPNDTFWDLGKADDFAAFAWRTGIESAQERRDKMPVIVRVHWNDFPKRLAEVIAKQTGKPVSPDEIRKVLQEDQPNDVRYIARGRLLTLISLARIGDEKLQHEILEALKDFPSDMLSDDQKLLKLRALELSFARHGRPSAEAVQALVKELLAIYPSTGGEKGAAASGALPSPAATKPNGEAALQNGAARRTDVAGEDARRFMLNRELSQLLIWLTNPELGELNADLAAASVGQASSLSGDGATNEKSAPGKNHPPVSPPSKPRVETGANGSPKTPPPRPEATITPRQAGSLSYIGAARALGPVPNPGASVFPGRMGDFALFATGHEVIEKTLALMDAAPSQEEQIQYALALRWAQGWTTGQRVRYFRWFHEKAAHYTGGNSFAKFVEAIRADAASRLPEFLRKGLQDGVLDQEYAALVQWLRPVAAPTPAAALKPRAFVKAWTLPELEAALDKLKDRPTDLARGRDIYTQAQCAQCHLFRDAGGNVGPDLTAVAQRFGRHDILESITDPSKVVSDQYAMVTLTILDGKGGTAEVSGLVKEETSATITLLTDPLAGTTKNLYKNVVTKREKAAVSTMPPGLLFTLTAEEVADLLALLGTK